jgi:hypothetical protein
VATSANAGDHLAMLDDAQGFTLVPLQPVIGPQLGLGGPGHALSLGVVALGPADRSGALTASSAPAFTNSNC